MTDAAVSFNAISLGGRGVTAVGTLKVQDGGFSWKKTQLRVRQKAGATLLFNGFPKAAAEELDAYAKEHFGMSLVRESYALSGHNWGKLTVHGASVAFQVEGKHAFELPLPEVGEVQGQKDEAIMEFHIDDTAISDREDALCAVTFLIPDGNKEFPANAEEGKTSAQHFKDTILDKTDVLAATQEEAIASISQVAGLVPRGRFTIEFHPGFMDMDGQNQQYKIRYTSMHRLYVLPRPVPQGNLVVIALDPPIRRGQTFYPQIVCFFDASTNLEIDLNITEEFMKRKNNENRANLELKMNGRADNVFTRILRGLSGAKVTKHGTFLASDRESPWLSCSYKNDAGTLYPLERAFFYVLKPTLLIPFEDIESVVFERQQSGMHAASVRTFDLMINMRSVDGRGRESQHLFRNIERSEWTNLLAFIEEKKIKIENLDTAKQGPSAGPNFTLAEGDADAGAAAGLDEEEDDDDFNGDGAGSVDEDFGGSAAGSSGGSSGGDSDSDAEIVEEEGITVDKISSSKKKREREEEAAADAPTPKKAPKQPRAPKAPKATEEGGKAKKPRKKKDKNAPKRGLSSYMFFSTAKREEVKAQNPGIGFGEIGKKIAALWAQQSAEDKAPYEEMARKDKERFERENAAYKATLAAGNADDAGDGPAGGSDGD